MPTRMHIMAGGKGGIGKTLCSLGIILAEQDNYNRGLIIDLNYHNLDLSETLSNVTNSIESQELGNSGFTISKIKNKHKSNNDSSNFLIYPTPQGEIYGRLPWEGGLGFLKQIDEILELVKDCPLIQNNIINYEPDYILVDTCLHLSNFNPKPSEKYMPYEEYSQFLSKELKNLRKTNPNIWFIWTLALLKRKSEKSAAQAAIIELKKIMNIDNSNKWFSDQDNFTHILNPHVMAKPRWKFGNNVTFKGLQKLKNSSSCPPISFEKFYRKAYAGISQTDNDDFQEYFDILASHIGSNKNDIKKQDLKKPENILIIPKFYSKYGGYTDTIEKKAQSKKDIKDELFLSDLMLVIPEMVEIFNEYLGK